MKIQIEEFDTYRTEAQARWGNTDAYKEHAEKTRDYSSNKWRGIAAAMDDIFGEFAACMKDGFAPEAEEVQRLVRKLQNHISEKFYTCTNEILFGLGQMYVSDERFQNHIDKYGTGTAEFVGKAIGVYCRKTSGTA